MGKIAHKITAVALAALMATGAVAGEVGTYIRDGKDGPQEIRVYIEDAKLYCTRISDGFEMCHGLIEDDDGRWRGRTMKHPDMPKFMTFNGTATFGPGAMSLRGCALGICDAEVWTEQ